MTAASYSGWGGRVSAAVRVNGELRSIATEFPADAVFPIYSITKTLTAIYPDTPVGRVSIATFVNSSCGPRADDCEATLLARLRDQGA